jgi:hypothetical protein
MLSALAVIQAVMPSGSQAGHSLDGHTVLGEDMLFALLIVCITLAYFAPRFDILMAWVIALTWLSLWLSSKDASSALLLSACVIALAALMAYCYSRILEIWQAKVERPLRELQVRESPLEIDEVVQVKRKVKSYGIKQEWKQWKVKSYQMGKWEMTGTSDQDLLKPTTHEVSLDEYEIRDGKGIVTYTEERTCPMMGNEGGMGNLNKVMDNAHAWLLIKVEYDYLETQAGEKAVNKWLKKTEWFRSHVTGGDGLSAQETHDGPFDNKKEAVDYDDEYLHKGVFFRSLTTDKLEHTEFQDRLSSWVKPKFYSLTHCTNENDQDSCNCQSYCTYAFSKEFWRQEKYPGPEAHCKTCQHVPKGLEQPGETCPAHFHAKDAAHLTQDYNSSYQEVAQRVKVK